MKCTKCGFISFDFNQVCPKCNRGLADEQKRLNLPPFRPDPPMLLGRLLGEPYDDADVEIISDRPTTMEEIGRITGAGLDDSLKGLEEDSISFEEDELDVVSLLRDEDKPKAEESIPDLEELSLEGPEITPSSRGHEGVAPDIIMEEEDLVLDETMMEPSGTGPDGSGIEHGERQDNGEEEITFNLDDISFEDLDTGGAQGRKSDLADVTEETPAADFGDLKGNGTMEAFYLDSTAEGLTKEIDMKKFRKDQDKWDKKPE